MPKPKKGETREHYLRRAIPVMRDEGLSQKAAVGKAEGMYDHARGRHGASEPIEGAGSAEELW